MTNRIHTAVDHAQAGASQPVADHVSRNAGIEELPPAHDAALAVRELGDDAINLTQLGLG
jgi:hypothetical protein